MWTLTLSSIQCTTVFGQEPSARGCRPLTRAELGAEEDVERCGTAGASDDLGLARALAAEPNCPRKTAVRPPHPARALAGAGALAVGCLVRAAVAGVQLEAGASAVSAAEAHTGLSHRATVMMTVMVLVMMMTIMMR